MLSQARTTLSVPTLAEMPEIHGEIEYVREDGTKVHSDICPKDCDSEGLKSSAYRKYLHDALDEWLDESRGTCGFYIRAGNHRFEQE